MKKLQILWTILSLTVLLIVGLLILWTIVITTFVRTQEGDVTVCSAVSVFPWFVNNPANCRAYWACASASAAPVPNECPTGLNFNEQDQICDIDYKCEDPTEPDPGPEPLPTTELPTTTTTVRPQPLSDVCKGLPDGYLVNDRTRCRAFFECENEDAVERQCNKGLNFNGILQICDHPTFTPCSNDDFECPMYGISRWEVPGSCITNNFCFGGQHRVETCAPGLIFDSEINLCALEEGVDCDRDLCPLYNDIDNIVTFPSEADCGQYYICYDNKRELGFCATGTHWNQENQRCERPEDARCGERSIKHVEVEPTRAKTR